MNTLTKDTAIRIAKRYCATYNKSPFSYMVVGKNENKCPGYYVYELFMANDDRKARRTTIHEGEFLIKVYNNLSKAKLIKNK